MGLLERLEAGIGAGFRTLRSALATSAKAPNSSAFSMLMGALDRRIPWSEQQRFAPGRGTSLATISSALENANTGYLQDFTDLSDEALSMDPSLCSLLQRRFGQLLRLPWTLEPACGDGIDKEQAKQIASDIRYGLENWPGGFHQLRLDSAWSIFHGRAATEAQWTRAPKAPDRPLEWMVTQTQWIHPRRISIGPERELRMNDNQEGGLSFQMGFSAEGINLEDAGAKGRFITAKAKLFNDYPEREGLARRAIYWTFFKRFSARERMVLSERYGSPFKVLETEVGAAVDSVAAERALDALEALGSSSNVMRLPVGMKLNIPWPDAAAGDIHSMTIDQCNAELEKLVVGTAMTTSDAGSGSRAKSEVGERQQDVILNLDALNESVVFQALVDVFFELNNRGVSVAYKPRFRTMAEAPADPDKRINRAVVVARDLGVPLPLEQVYEVSGYRRPKDDEEVVAVIGGATGVPQLFETMEAFQAALDAAEEAKEKAAAAEEKAAGQTQEQHTAGLEQQSAATEKTYAEAKTIASKSKKPVVASALALGEWDETKHSRDERGRFAGTGSGSSWTETGARAHGVEEQGKLDQLFRRVEIAPSTLQQREQWTNQQREIDLRMEAQTAAAPSPSVERVDDMAEAVASTMIGSPFGFSVRGDGSPPASGYMVSRAPEEPGRSFVISGKGKSLAGLVADIRTWVAETAPFVEANSRMFYGGWKGDDGNYYLDLSENVGSRSRAIYEASQRNQRGVFDVARQDVIDTGGSGASRKKDVG